MGCGDEDAEMRMQMDKVQFHYILPYIIKSS